MSGGERPGPKSQGAKRLGPKCQGVKRPCPKCHQTICKSDAFKGLEMMGCSNKVPKHVANDVTRGRTDSSYYSI